MKKVFCLLICLSLILSIGLMTVFADPASDTTGPDTEPAASTTPSDSPSSTDEPEPSETADPTESPDPSETTDPSESPAPSETTTPSESPAPSETTTPSESPAPSETVAPTPEPKAIFDDVPATGKWYSEPVRFVAENGYMAGVSATKFDPDAFVTRGMVTTILYSMDGKPSVTAPNKFKDVVAGKWYTTSVIWANYYGIVAGYEDGTFRPEQAVTRQDFAAILYKYSSVTKKNVTAAGNIDVFRDKSTISNYAVTPMKWAVGNELLSGMGNGILLPKGNATRAQLATIIKAYVTKLDNGQHTAPVNVPVNTPAPSVKPAPVTPLTPTTPSNDSGSTPRTTPTNTNSDIVYWVAGGSVYHSTNKCPALARSSNIKSGPLSQCPKTRPCKDCH